MKFGSKVSNRQKFSYEKQSFYEKKCLLITLLPNFLVPLKMDPYIKITMKFTKKFGSKVINRQWFHRKTRLQS